MKKIKLSISCIALSILTLNSCKKKEEVVKTDDNNTTTTNTNNGDENKKLSVTELSAGVKVEGATEKTGTPPAPNSQLDFQMSSEKQQGIRNEGFDIKFTSTEDIKGAYIRLADVDGNKVDGYLDVPVTVNSARPTKNTSKKEFLGRASADTSSSANEYEIDIDFEQSLTPGKFCYFICLYNGSGQVSQIQERCITVEEWGGDNKIVGTWKFTNFSDNSDDLSEYYVPCGSGDSVLVKDSLISEDWTLIIYQNGTYKEDIKSSAYYADQDLAFDSCTFQLENTISNNDNTYKGNWAYDSENNTFTAIDYEVIDNLDASNSEKYDNGELYLDKSPVVINGNKLELQNFEGEGSVTAYFTKQ